MQAAARFGRAPSEFWALSQDDQAYMMALAQVEREMAAWDTQEAMREAKKRKNV